MENFDKEYKYGPYILFKKWENAFSTMSRWHKFWMRVASVLAVLITVLGMVIIAGGVVILLVPPLVAENYTFFGTGTYIFVLGLMTTFAPTLLLNALDI